MTSAVLAAGALWFAGIAVLAVVAGAVAVRRRRTRRASADPDDDSQLGQDPSA